MTQTFRTYAQCAWLLCGAVACRTPQEPSNGRPGGTIVFTMSNAQQVISGPHSSIVDSLIVDVSAAGNTEQQSIRRKLSRTDSVVSLTVTLSDGVANVDARVVSRNQTLLYRGLGSGAVAANGFTIPVSLVAQGPVLAVAPDTMRVVIGSVLSRQGDTLRVYNRGSGTMTASIAYFSGGCGQGCTVTPAAVSVPAGGVVGVVVRALFFQTGTAIIGVVMGRDTLLVPVRATQ